MAPFQEAISRNNSCMDLNSHPKEKRCLQVPLDDKISLQDAIVVGTAALDLQESSQEDAFLRYSDDDTRMKKLLLQDDDDRAQSSFKSKKPKRQVERKTRISYELHHSLVMEDELLALFGEDDDDCSGLDSDLDFDEEMMKSLSKKELMDLLLQLQM